MNTCFLYIIYILTNFSERECNKFDRVVTNSVFQFQYFDINVQEILLDFLSWYSNKMMNLVCFNLINFFIVYLTLIYDDRMGLIKL
jgi:hypothetical protein